VLQRHRCPTRRPFGPLFFDLGLHPFLLSLQTKYPKLLLALAFHDDTTLAGPRSLLVTIAKELHSFYREDNPNNTMGMVLNLAKTQLWDPSMPEERDEYEGVNRVRDGLIFLGGPLGFSDKENAAGLDSVNFTLNYLSTNLLEKCVSISRLRELPAHIAWLLLQACINTRPMYLLRTIAPWITKDAIANFDAAVDAEVARITKWQGDLPAVTKLVRGLPQRDGGCSLRRLGSSADCAFSASFLTASQFVQRQIPALWRILTKSNALLLPHHTEVLKATVPRFNCIDPSGILIDDPPTDPAANPGESSPAPREAGSPSTNSNECAILASPQQITRPSLNAALLGFKPRLPPNPRLPETVPGLPPQSS
jgi:hypothetical protein